jgi:hypothetical protein
MHWENVLGLRSTARQILWLTTLSSLAISAAERASAPPMRAMWVYETKLLLASSAARAELFQFCGPRRITDLFLQTHFEKQGKEGPCQIADAAAMQIFLREAAQHRLRVHALTGDPKQVLTAHHGRVLALVDAFAAFNQSAGSDGRFAGLHLDIEPHAMPEWKSASLEEKCRLLTQFVELNAKVVERLHASAPGALYGADIAFWLDKMKQDGTPAYPVTYHGTTKDATKHLLDMVDNLGLMSYRGKVEGPNGIIPLVEKSITYADTAKGRAFVGVKMAQVGLAMESFYGRTEPEMMAELGKVDQTYGPHRGYAGLAFFMYSAYRSMPQQGK